MTEPPFPEAIVRRTWGTVPGLSRRLNKRSFARGCLKTASCAPNDVHYASFLNATRYASLAFGTKVGDGLTGEVLSYAGAARDRVLATLNRREGWNAHQPIEMCGYLQTTLEVHTQTGVMPCISYVSNPQGVHHIDGLTLHDVARLLLRATPKSRGLRACGVHYVSSVAHWLDAAGNPDPYLQQVLRFIEKNRKDDEK